jgi:hypothetical protein
MAIASPIQAPRTSDPKEIERFFREAANRYSYIEYAGNPNSHVTPRWVGDICLSTTTSQWYKAASLLNTSWERTSFSGSHGDLSDLGDDDHTQYLKEKASGGLAAEVPTHTHADAANAGTVDHGALTGLTDDDHTQYLKEITPTTDNGIVRWSGTSGAAVENSGVRIDDNDDILLNDSDKVRLGTGQDCDLYHDGTKNICRLNNGELQIGGADNYTAIETDGTVKFNGDATVWDDLRITPGSFDRPGTSDPTIVAYQPGGSGTTTYLYQFDAGNIASFTVQLPHGYKLGSTVYVHIHWTPGPRGNEENGALVGWKVDYSWADINGNFGTMTTADLSDACDGTDHKHQMTPELALTGSASGVSSMLICNVKRTDTGTDDTWAGTLSGERPLLLEIDFHFEIDTVGSRQKASK